MALSSPDVAGRRYPSSATLMAGAMAISGLSDFGPGDFREGLDVLLDSLEHDAHLEPSAPERVARILLRRLVNRLEVEQWYRSHPELEALTVRGPVDIVALPRTGTTALANMMSLDPAFRCLRGWEQAKPCPPPILGREARDPRRLKFAGRIDRMSPEEKALHLNELDATREDADLLRMAFHDQSFGWPVHRYHAWWRSADPTAAYHYHRRVVVLLQSRRPPNLWLFKAPHHLFHLEAVVNAYRDAKFVMTHRDPAKVVPSYASLLARSSRAGGGEQHMHRLGREVSEHLRIGVRNAIAARERLGEDRFLDLHHHELVRDPAGTLRRVYDFLGMPWPQEVRRSVEAWQRRNRPGAYGPHDYTAEQFGLRAADIRRDYDFYIERFGVKTQ
ncbi:sulfotransferase family protein [Mycobacterium parmense]|uniref:Putative sulfotransferase n=1 Tax=Mycobacterium parmense TaxID=185642 RepID=A0A7I7YX72_9MYCO|nr:sulfotransferase [Mycobacterium parmense]MCV7350000.1 sulfotransferase [Mycobacterium parmense]ORW59281.1 sulfotransferase [Mycobacterium parmense]BBZ46468.1 putative sulfotransferase [Mycobacterium parmense]